MARKYLQVIFLILFFVVKVYSQNTFTSQDSLLVKNNLTFKSELSANTAFYELPVPPMGFKLELINTDNLCVINSRLIVFNPLSDIQVQLFLKLTKLSDGSFMEFNVPILVKAKYQSHGSNPKPNVLPALREWSGAQGNLILPKSIRIVVSKNAYATLKPLAETLLAELKAKKNFVPKIIIGKPQPGDLYFSLDGSKTELGEEGYYFEVSQYVHVKAATYKAAFWGSRTLLQLLEQSSNPMSLPKGIARDYPKYEVRGFLLDVGRKFFSIEFLKNYVRLMSYYKMSDFQIHLNDNAFVAHYGGKWDSTYCGFRLESATYPTLPTKGEFYTKAQFIDLQILAERYAVRIIPEIDVPAHSLAITRAFPQIASKEFGADHLDLKNPETYKIVEKIFKEYLEGPNPVFRNHEVHIGTDEYAKKEAENFRHFTDHFIKYVQSFGKDVRVWGALTHAQGETPVTNKRVTMNAWYNGYAEPLEMKKLGYPLISTPDGSLYIVPAAGYYYDYLNLKRLYTSWEPVNVGNVRFKFGDPIIRGGMFALWNDVSKNGITSGDVSDRVFPAIQVLSQKMWMGVDDKLSYEQFSLNARSLNEGPGNNIRAKIGTNDSLVFQYLTEKAEKPNGLKESSIINSKKGKVLQFKSSKAKVNLPYEEIGYDYTVSFMLSPQEANQPDAILFSSQNATVKLLQGTSGFIGFSREKKDYHFGVALPANTWTCVAITGDNNSTSLYLNGKHIKTLTREKVPTGFKNDSIWEMRTLVFPLRSIGGRNNSFKGKMKELKVFNKKLSAFDIETLSVKKQEIVPM